MINQFMILGKLVSIDKESLCIHLEDENIDMNIIVPTKFGTRLQEHANIGEPIGLRGRIGMNSEMQPSLIVEEVSIISKSKGQRQHTKKQSEIIR